MQETFVGKWERTPSEGQEVVQDAENKSHPCGNCGKKQDGTNTQRCAKCKTVYYFSRRCQKDHWKIHQPLCDAIVVMNAKESEKEKQWLKKGQYISHLTPKQHNTVIKLVGNRCLVKCSMNDIPTEALWDTGAQVSIASHEWVTTNLANSEIHPLEELLGDNELDLKAANGSSIPFQGWVEAKFKLWNSAIDREVTLSTPPGSSGQPRISHHWL